MSIGLDTAVYCNDEYCGITRYLIVQPARMFLTFLAVKPANLQAFANRVERLVPISLISDITDNGIRLECTAGDLSKLRPFTETHYTEIPESDYSMLEYGFMPPMIGSQAWMSAPVIDYNMLPGEMMISRQVQIEAKNGYLGQFEGFVVQPKTGEIIFLVFLWGHMWERQRGTVPAAQIDSITEDAIYLTIDRSDLIK